MRTVVVTGIAGSLGQRVSARLTARPDVDRVVGIDVVPTWVNRPQNEVIWVRTFADEQDRETKIKAFQEAARAEGIQLGGHVAKRARREVDRLADLKLVLFQRDLLLNTPQIRSARALLWIAILCICQRVLRLFLYI